jgi:hypothetical protein
VSISVGFAFNWGSSSNFTFDDPASSSMFTTKLNVTTLSLLYAVTYQF